MSSQVNMAAPPRTARRRGIARRFYIGMALCTIMIVVLGFAPSIIDASERNAPLTSLVVVHSLVAIIWLALFLAQTTLVAMRRTAIHRRLGIAAVLLALVMVVLGYMAAIAMARRGFDLSGDLQ